MPDAGHQTSGGDDVAVGGLEPGRRVVIAQTPKPTNRGPQEEFWGVAEDEVSVYVTNLTVAEAAAEQIVGLYRKRADTENVFDEVKNQWGFRGFCSQRGVVTESAARLVWLTYNLWTLFVRFCFDGYSCFNSFS